MGKKVVYFLLFILSLGAHTAGAADVPVYDLHVRMEPASGALEVEGSVELPAGNHRLLLDPATGKT